MAARNSCSRSLGLADLLLALAQQLADALGELAPDARPARRQRRRRRCAARRAAACARTGVEHQPQQRAAARRRASAPRSRSSAPARPPPSSEASRNVAMRKGMRAIIRAVDARGRARRGASGRDLRREPVAGAAHGLDHGGRARPAPRAGASRARRPCAPRCRRGRPRPCRATACGCAPARDAHEEVQQLELGRPDLERRALPGHAVRGGVERQLADLDALVGRLRRAAAQHGADARQHLLRARTAW